MLAALAEENPTAEDVDIARVFLTGLKVSQRAFALLLGLVADEVRRIRRDAVREIETEAFAEGQTLDLTDAEGDPLSARKRLLDQTMFVPGEGLVLWGAATVEQHQARIEFLSRKRNGLDLTIAHHEAAIARIIAAGGTCLNDLEDDEDDEDDEA